jgi:hypothetical protein
VVDITVGYSTTITHEAGVAMREKREQQLSLFHIMPRNEIGKELEAISRIIDENPGILDVVHWDFVGMKNAETGRTGMTMVRSSWVYKKLRNFLAGIEANISVLKRAFGLMQCTWSGWAGFKQYVRSAIVSYNLL